MASPIRPNGFSCLKALGLSQNVLMLLCQRSVPLSHAAGRQRPLGSRAVDILLTATGLLPFIVHEAHCQQAKQKDRHAWKTAHDANQATPWGLTGYFLDPDLFQMLAHSARLQLSSSSTFRPGGR